VALVTLIVVAAIWLGAQRLNNGAQPIGAEVQMTPIMGGMAVSTTNATSGEPEVTATTGSNDPAVRASTVVLSETEALSETAAVTATDGVTAGVALTESAPLTSAPVVSGAEEVTAIVATGEISELVAVTATGANTETDAVATPVATETPTTAPTPTVAPTPTATPRPVVPPPVFAPGERVSVRAGRAPLYAEPSASAPVLDAVSEGSTLTVLEPGGDFASYPVEQAGQGWVRVRAADGLVGWTPTEGLVPES
jgi:hypothetical protein